MASNPATRQPAQAPPDAAIAPEKDCTCRDKSERQEPLAPRAGRTGGLGARAERPSEGSLRKAEDKAAPRRGAKAPSAKAPAHTGERSSK